MKAGQDYEIRGRGDRDAFQVTSSGSGTVYAAVSMDPYHMDDFVRNNHWDYARLDDDSAATNDPEAAMTNIVEQMADGNHFDYDVATYTVESSYASSQRAYISPTGGYGTRASTARGIRGVMATIRRPRTSAWTSASASADSGAIARTGFGFGFFRATDLASASAAVLRRRLLHSARLRRDRLRLLRWPRLELQPQADHPRPRRRLRGWKSRRTRPGWQLDRLSQQRHVRERTRRCIAALRRLSLQHAARTVARQRLAGPVRSTWIRSAGE